MQFDDNEVEKFLKKLKNAKEDSSEQSYDDIKNILNSIEFNIPLAIFPQGSNFLRCRIHNENESFFYKVKDLSYRTDLENITNFGRANEPGQSIFYCSNNDWISYVEISKIAREMEDKPFEYISGGLWVAKEDIYAVTLMSNDNISGKNKELEEISKNLQKHIADQNDEASKAYLKLIQFLSKEFSTEAKKNSKHYKITAAFTNYIFENLKNADCIVYPSTLDVERGLNFAFKPESVDKKLHFYSAMRRKMQKTSDTNFKETEFIESEYYRDKTEDISWSK